MPRGQGAAVQWSSVLPVALICFGVLVGGYALWSIVSTPRATLFRPLA